MRSLTDVDLCAFPHERLQELKASPGRHIAASDICRDKPTPVFLISFNRGTMLRRVIASLGHLSTPIDIVIHDNGSADPDTLAILDALEARGLKVFRYPAITSADELNQVDDSVRRYFSDWGEPVHYVVSDCDIDISIADPNLLLVYSELLNKFPKIECVGPMLRIRDVPRNYPLFNRVMNLHIERWWGRTPNFYETSFGEVAILEGPIDTTFALHRAGEPFKRLKSGMRVYEPFEAQHLDWYLDETSNDAKAYAESSSEGISHWNNNRERARYQGAQLEYSTFYYVRRNAGALEIHTGLLDAFVETGPALVAASPPPTGDLEADKADLCTGRSARSVIETQAAQVKQLTDQRSAVQPDIRRGWWRWLTGK